MRANAIASIIAVAALLIAGLDRAPAFAVDANGQTEATTANVPPRSGTCSAAEIGEAVDTSAAQIRAFGAKSQPDIAASMRRYAEAKGLTGDATEDVVFEQVYDAKLQQLDNRSGELLLKVDQLGRTEDGAQPDCSRRDEIARTTAELLEVMQAKSQYLLSRLEALTPKAAEALEDAGNVAAPGPTAPKSEQDAQPKPPRAETAAKAAKPQAPAATAANTPAKTWTAETQANDAYQPPEAAEDTTVAGAAGGAPLPGMPPPNQAGGYSIDEIRDATRGFFGTISTNLASVLEHAFKTSGRPTAYVLGTEGGGAFLAGLRYGKGRLFRRNHNEVTNVYWHGPSLGTDFGASGSRTMFLIYGLGDDADIHRVYTGIDGSAYFVGGIGVTFLKGGNVIMAPIRSGIGLRFGANIGYVRFTPKPTWNPF